MQGPKRRVCGMFWGGVFLVLGGPKPETNNLMGLLVCCWWPCKAPKHVLCFCVWFVGEGGREAKVLLLLLGVFPLDCCPAVPKPRKPETRQQKQNRGGHLENKSNTK